MSDQQREIGVIQALLERLEDHTLPRALDILAKVDGGAQLDELDARFLEDAMQGLRENGPYILSHPDWEPLYSRMIDLYHQITTKALANARVASSAA
jgi:hypothetical protein